MDGKPLAGRLAQSFDVDAVRPACGHRQFLKDRSSLTGRRTYQRLSTLIGVLSTQGADDLLKVGQTFGIASVSFEPHRPKDAGNAH